MRYFLLFISVFALSFLTIQWACQSNTETDTATIEIAEAPDLKQDSVTHQVSVDTSSSKPLEIKMVDGYLDITWKHLSKVIFEERFNDSLQVMIPYPVFHQTIKELDGKKIQIKGYVIPFEETGDETIVILSAFPFSSCFFCGGAGAETVIDVQMKKTGMTFKQDAMHTFRGRLRLNDSDLDYLNYILDDATILD